MTINKLRFAAVVTIAAGLTIGTVLPATAAAPATTPIGVSEPAVVSSPPLSDDAALQKLHELAKTQTAKEIAKILKSDDRVVSLRNEAGDIVAAYVEEPASVSLFAVTPVYVGCSPTDACAYTNGGASPIGFYGTGTLSITLNNVTKTFSGDKYTCWWYYAGGNKADCAKANNVNYITGGRQYLSVVRS